MASLAERLFRPYLDLSDCREGPLNAYGPPVSFERLVAGRDDPTRFLLVQRLMSTGFRYRLARWLGQPVYSALSPMAVPSSLRSERWGVLCEYVDGYTKLNQHQQHAVSHLLITLGYYELALILLREHAECPQEATPQEAALAYARAFTRFMLYSRSPEYRPDDIRLTAQRAPLGSVTRYDATLRMLVYHARFVPDADTAAHWCQEAVHAAAALPAASGSFAYYILWSRLWRAASYVPYLKQDAVRTAEELAQSEALLRQVNWDGTREEMIWRANIYPVYQSQARLAEVQGDWPTALDLGYRMVELDPWYSNAHLEVGNNLLRTGEIERAALAFLRAANLGPPVHEIARFLAGYAYEQSDRPGLAAHMYIKAVTLDPEASSPREGLGRLMSGPRWGRPERPASS